MISKSKTKELKKLDEPLSEEAILQAKISNKKIISILKNKNKWVIISHENERPIFISSNKNEAIKEAKNIFANQNCTLNIYDVDHNLIKTINISKNE